jgi:branched-chain amino acid transport system ATP-binding protein
MLELINVSASYGPIRALAGVSLTVERGEIVAILGANGAGKTTLLNAISGLLRPQSGHIGFARRATVGCAAEQMVSLGVSHVPERRQIFATMSVLDNLRLGAYHRRRHDWRADVEFVFQLFPILAQRKTQDGGTLSGGEQQMLAIARGLMSKPQLLLLDEPSLGLAPLIVKELMRVIAELRQQGLTVMLVEQNARAALKIADRGYVLETGRVVLEGKAVELMANPEVQHAYLGSV